MFVSYRFADNWRQEELSDVTVQITAPDSTTLTQLPGHGIILSQSPFFKAQILRWQSDENTRRDTSRSSAAAAAAGAEPHASMAGQPGVKREPAGHTDDASGNADGMEISTAVGADGANSKPRLVLTLQDAAEEPAAVAVLAALYGVKPIPELLSELPQEQQLHAALLADMWQVPGVSTAAVKLLVDAATADQGLSEAAYKQFLQLAAPPTCLLPLFQVLVGLLSQQQQLADQQSQATLRRMLLSVLGDLEEVWADEALKNTLLRLPLPAMIMLLSCDELKVATEDNVLYAAELYSFGFFINLQQYEAAQQALAPVVRAQHLSQFWLSASALSHSASMLGSYGAQLRQLLMLKAGVGSSGLQNAELQQLIPGAPDSWGAGQRSIRAAPAGEVTWEVDVSTIPGAVQHSAQLQQQVTLNSPATTPPIGGLIFGIQVGVKWLPDAKVNEVNVYSKPRNAPEGTYFRYKFELTAAGKAYPSIWTPIMSGSQGMSGWHLTGPMTGGWDAAAWAQAGLPSAGVLVFKLKVTSVAHGW